MKIEEKASDIIRKVLKANNSSKLYPTDKNCAIVVVEEVLEALNTPPIENKGHMLWESQVDYWNQVLEEIKKRTPVHF